MPEPKDDAAAATNDDAAESMTSEPAADGPIAGTTAEDHEAQRDAGREIDEKTQKPFDPTVPSEKLGAEMASENPNLPKTAVDPDAERHAMAVQAASDRDYLQRGMQPLRRQPHIPGTSPEERAALAAGGVPRTDAGGYYEGDTALAHARRLLSAPNHANGMQIPLSRLGDIDDMGLHHIVMDVEGRVWRVEMPNNQNGRSKPVLVLVGRLQT